MREAFAIADNRLTENSVWNEGLLAEHLKCLSEAELDFSLEATGFEVGEIDVLIEGLAPAGENRADPADSLPEMQESAPITKPGDSWLLHRHRVLCGNALDETSFRLLMQNRKAAMVFVDPSYNVPIVGHATGLGAVRHRDFAMARGEMSSGEYTDSWRRDSICWRVTASKVQFTMSAVTGGTSGNRWMPGIRSIQNSRIYACGPRITLGWGHFIVRSMNSFLSLKLAEDLIAIISSSVKTDDTEPTFGGNSAPRMLLMFIGHLLLAFA
jgi:hypothetical protein